jgi:hypothetical protein
VSAVAAVEFVGRQTSRDECWLAARRALWQVSPEQDRSSAVLHLQLQVLDAA